MDVSESVLRNYGIVEVSHPLWSRTVVVVSVHIVIVSVHSCDQEVRRETKVPNLSR